MNKSRRHFSRHIIFFEKLSFFLVKETFELQTNVFTCTHVHKTDQSTVITNLLPIDQKKGVLMSCKK